MHITRISFAFKRHLCLSKPLLAPDACLQTSVKYFYSVPQYRTGKGLSSLAWQDFWQRQPAAPYRPNPCCCSFLLLWGSQAACLPLTEGQAGQGRGGWGEALGRGDPQERQRGDRLRVTETEGLGGKRQDVAGTKQVEDGWRAKSKGVRHEALISEGEQRWVARKRKGGETKEAGGQVRQRDMRRVSHYDSLSLLHAPGPWPQPQSPRPNQETGGSIGRLLWVRVQTQRRGWGGGGCPHHWNEAAWNKETDNGRNMDLKLFFPVIQII